MSGADVFYIIVGFSFLMLVFFVGYTAWQLSLTLRVLRGVIDDIHDTTRDFTRVKNGLKVGALSIVMQALNTVSRHRKGGEV